MEITWTADSLKVAQTRQPRVIPSSSQLVRVTIAIILIPVSRTTLTNGPDGIRSATVASRVWRALDLNGPGERMISSDLRTATTWPENAAVIRI